MDTDFVDRWSVRLSGVKSRRALSVLLVGMTVDVLRSTNALARNKRGRKSGGKKRRKQNKQQGAVSPPKTTAPPVSPDDTTKEPPKTCEECKKQGLHTAQCRDLCQIVIVDNYCDMFPPCHSSPEGEGCIALAGKVWNEERQLCCGCGNVCNIDPGWERVDQCPPAAQPTCNPELRCGEALTCVGEWLYPTTCGPRNCDEPIGPCKET